MARYSGQQNHEIWRFLGKACLITLLAVGCLVGGWAMGSLYPLPFLTGDAPRASSGAQASSAASEPQPESGPASEASSQAPVSSAAEQPGIPQDKGMFSPWYQAAWNRMQSMSLREMVAQVFVFRCPDSGAVKMIDDYQPGGYCLMANAFEGKTAEQVQKMTASYQNSSKVPMILCCDEEGGTVVRVSRNPALAGEPFQSPQQVFAQGGMDAIVSDTQEKAALLKSLGLNLNLAPVADVSTNPANFIYDRSFGKSAAETADFVRTSVQAYKSAGLGCTLKHFPGYGDNGDTHEGIVYDNRSLETLESSDFLPFQAGIEAGAPCVLVSHNIVACLDPEAPASLSPKVHQVLREELGFTGIVMTDDLIMEAIRQYTGGENPAVAAFLAGNDILLSSDSREDFDSLYQAVQDGTVTEERLQESVVRILAWKYSMGLL